MRRLVSGLADVLKAHVDPPRMPRIHLDVSVGIKLKVNPPRKPTPNRKETIMVAPLFAVLFILAVAAPIITRWIHQQRGDENESTLMDDGSLNWKVLGGSQGDLIFQVSVATVTAMGRLHCGDTHRLGARYIRAVYVRHGRAGLSAADVRAVRSALHARAAQTTRRTSWPTPATSRSS